MFITGSTGTGKSYLSSAIAYHACQVGIKVFYANTAKLMGQLKLAKAKGTIINNFKKIERAELLILDDFGLQPFDSQSRVVLLDIIEDRNERLSTIITSQIPVKEWYDVIGENNCRCGSGQNRPSISEGGTTRRIPEKKKISARKYIFVKENY